MAVKYNKINDKKYEIVNNGQIIGVVTKNDNETVWTATSTTDKNIFAFRPTRKRATDGLIWKMENK